MIVHEVVCSGEKVCKGRCGRKLPALAFAVHRSSKDGLHTECRECGRERAAERRARTGRGQRRTQRAMFRYPDGMPPCEN